MLDRFDKTEQVTHSITTKQDSHIERLINENTINLTDMPDKINEIGSIQEMYISRLVDGVKTKGDISNQPPASNEWRNTVYTYDKNYTKLLPSADAITRKMIDSYFSFSPVYNDRKSKGIEVRLKRLSLNKILLSKSEIKHTNDEVVITLYIYNRSKKLIMKNLRYLYNTFFLYTSKFKSKLNRWNNKKKSSIYKKKSNKKNVPKITHTVLYKTGVYKIFRYKNLHGKRQFRHKSLYVKPASKRNNKISEYTMLHKGKEYKKFFINNKTVFKPTHEGINNTDKRIKISVRKKIVNSIKAFTNKHRGYNNSKHNQPKNKKNIFDFNVAMSSSKLSMFIVKVKSNYLSSLKNRHLLLKSVNTHNYTATSSTAKNLKFKANYYLNYTNLLKSNIINEHNGLLYTRLFEKLRNYIKIRYIKRTANLNNFVKLFNRKGKYTRRGKYTKKEMYKLTSLYKAIETGNTRYNLPEIANALSDKLANFARENIYKTIKKPFSYKVNKNLRTRKVSFRIGGVLKNINKYRHSVIINIGKLFKLNNSLLNNYMEKYESVFINKLIKKAYRKEVLYLYYLKALAYNVNKYKEWFMLGLKKTISKIYKKRIVFNIVNLKYLHLNSDIFSQAISIKLKNRENRLLSVLKKSLKLVKLPSTHNLTIYGKNNKKIKKNFVFSPEDQPILVNDTLQNNDTLHILLNKIYSDKRDNDIQSKVLSYLKHKAVFGVRLEAAGRLSRRLTASRSVFKFKYKGSLKNIDSSVTGLSSPILKGSTRSNVQYANIDSKTRNGSFGLKTWISGH